jgi:hypothetical protein
MVNSASSVLRGALWLANIALALFVAAMTVTPQMAVTNVTTWLEFLGLKSGAGWLATHAAHRVHFSRPEISESSRTPCLSPCHSSSGFDVPDVILYALGALLVSLVVIWLLRRRKPALATQPRG